jgi:uncharacterized protein
VIFTCISGKYQRSRPGRCYCFESKWKRSSKKQDKTDLQRTFLQKQKRFPSFFRYPHDACGQLFARICRNKKQLRSMEKMCKTIASILLLFCIRTIKALLVVPRGTCRFYPSCSEYASEALATLPLHRACFCIAKRVLKCNPFIRAGYDPVPRTTERPHCCE